MKHLDFQIANEFRHHLELIIPVIDARIFGSCVRGTSEPSSDLDIFIKVNYLDRSLREKIYDLAWEIGFKYDRIISTFVVTEEELTLPPLNPTGYSGGFLVHRLAVRRQPI
ncbi:MAG: nucleotidyltransferase domain-containing protein, partial [Cyanobacterium sp. T60_A2020_053]|nr:nucleotidyltransferase domain-containing protein [Cyanobacterium sp. T60_A2020_053]